MPDKRPPGAGTPETATLQRNHHNVTEIRTPFQHAIEIDERSVIAQILEAVANVDISTKRRLGFRLTGVTRELHDILKQAKLARYS